MLRQELREKISSMRNKGALLPQRTARYERLSWPVLDAELTHSQDPDESW